MILLSRTLPSGLRLDLLPLTFGRARLQVVFVHHCGEGLSYPDVVEDWWFPGMGAAVAALGQWDGKGEPLGWDRHPATGRYRMNGNPEVEYTVDRETGSRVFTRKEPLMRKLTIEVDDDDQAAAFSAAWSNPQTRATVLILGSTLGGLNVEQRTRVIRSVEGKLAGELVAAGGGLTH